MLNPGERIHVLHRRLFPDEPQRHFVGEVVEATSTIARVDGHDFLLDPIRGQFSRQPQRRTRILSLTDAANHVTILPEGLDVDALSFQVTVDRRIVLRDEQGFQLQLPEIGPNRGPRMSRELL